MLNQQKDWMEFSSYWGTYNRVLLRQGGIFSEQIELSLTPVNPDFPDTWDQVKLCRIRKHCTARGVRDTISHHISDNLYRHMEENMGEVLTDFIFNYDIYSKLKEIKARRNWYLFERFISQGGGVPLVLIDPNFDLLREDWVKGRSFHYTDIKQRIMEKLNIGLNEVNDLSFYGILERLDQTESERSGGIINWMGV